MVEATQLTTIIFHNQKEMPSHTVNAIPLLAAFPDEGLWDMFVKDIPRSATSYTVSLDKLKQGVTYEFRVVAVNEFGYGEPSVPSVAVSGNRVCVLMLSNRFPYWRWRRKKK